ncbi:MAG: carbohydrate ABC transporter permease [Aggregatilineales bacterium]
MATQDTAGNRRSLFPNVNRMRENITGWLFISPAVMLIAIFGLFPIGYAFFMSTFEWIILPRQNYCLPGIDLSEQNFQALDFGTEILPNLDLTQCLANYLKQFGNWSGLFLFMAGFVFIFIAFSAWGRIRNRIAPVINLGAVRVEETQESLFSRVFNTGILIAIIGFFLFYGVSLLGSDRLFGVDRSLEGILLIISAIILAFLTLWAGMAAKLPIFAPIEKITEKQIQPESIQNRIVSIVITVLLLFLGTGIIATGWSEMRIAGNERLLQGLIYTFYYAIASVPIQLGLGLVLAYLLYQKIQGKELYRMLFFLPYITPAVAAAVIFRIVFSPRPSSLANQFISTFGLPSQDWLQEPEPFLNAFFGLNLEGFIAGPSMALISIVLLGIWTYTGYNAVIFLAGLGQIPGDLYEAARVDGANEWHLFRFITLPLISPITFYLSVLAFIGTFKTFNSIFVMRSPNALGTVDTASIVVFDTFQKASRYGEATAQAILLLFIILAITQFQRSVLEKRVFYG